MSIKKNNYKYTNNEIKLINEHYQNYDFIYLYKFNYTISDYKNETNNLENYFNDYFSNKNYNKLSNFDKLTFNIILVNKLIVILNKNKVLINNGNDNYQKKFLYNIINSNCDLFIKRFYKYENYCRYIEPCNINISNFYENCSHSEVYTRKFSNIKMLENFLILTNNGINTLRLFEYRSNFFDSFLYNMNKLSPIINPDFFCNDEIDSCISHNDVIIFYNRLTKKISLNFIKDKEIFDNFLEKKHEIFIKNFFKFLEKNFDWDFILQNVNQCNFCNKEINLIDIRDIKYSFDSKKKEITVINNPIIHSKTVCFPENNIIINDNINNYKLINVYKN